MDRIVVRYCPACGSTVRRTRLNRYTCERCHHRWLIQELTAAGRRPDEVRQARLGGLPDRPYAELAARLRRALEEEEVEA